MLREELLTWKGRILSGINRTEEAIVSYRQAFEAGLQLPSLDNRSYHVISGYLLGDLLYQRGDKAAAKKYLRQIVGANAEPEYRKSAEDLLNKIEQNN